MDRVIEQSIQEFDKKLFPLSQSFCYAMKKKQLRKDKKTMNMNNILKISKLRVVRLNRNQKTK